MDPDAAGTPGVASVVDAMAELGLDGLLDGPDRRLGPTGFVGTAVTVEFGDPAAAREGDGRQLWSVIDQAPPGSVLVLATNSARISALGGVIAGTAAARGLAAAVTDGLIRDVDEIAGYSFAVRYREAHARAIRGSFAGSGHTVRIDGIAVASGDLIVGDGDGVVRVPRDIAAAVMDRARAIERLERLWVDQARADRSIAVGYDTVARRFGSPHPERAASS